VILDLSQRLLEEHEQHVFRRGGLQGLRNGRHAKGGGPCQSSAGAGTAWPPNMREQSQALATRPSGAGPTWPPQLVRIMHLEQL